MRLGPCEIVAPLGEGGMGQVYRATGTTLGRQVAIKILPDAFASDTDRLARFEREAKTLASLNHPHIAAIYGFEKSGGTHALVMELVEGETLQEKLAHVSSLKSEGSTASRDGKVRTVPARGGPTLVVCEIPESHQTMGLVWVGDEMVIAVWQGGLYRVDARNRTCATSRCRPMAGCWRMSTTSRAWPMSS